MIDFYVLLQTVIGVAIGSAIAPFIFYYIIKRFIVRDVLKMINRELEKPSNKILLSQIKEKVLKGMFDIDINDKPPELEVKKNER